MSATLRSEGRRGPRRLVSEHFKRSGRPKLSFENRRAAQAYVEDRHQVGDLKAYRCSFCESWHVASIH